jgi:hypothetical protein
MKMGRSGSNAGPKPADNAVMSSMVAPESLERSEFIALFRGLDSECIPATISVANAHPPFLQHSVSCTMPCSMVFQDAPVS